VSNRPPEFHVDKETFSEIDLTEVGAARYAEDPSTETLMMAISKDDGPVWLWIDPRYRDVFPGLHEPESEDLIEELRNTPEALVYAHSAQFERYTSLYVKGDPLAFMKDRWDKWRCTAAMARRAAIPDSLEKSTGFLNLAEKKDAKGKALIKLFSEPNTPRRKKGEAQKPDFRVFPADQPEKFRQFGEYCVQDVVSEKELHKALSYVELKGPALEGFLLDVWLNDRGVPVDVPALQNAQRIIDEKLAGKSSIFTKLTDGLSPTQNKASKAWLHEHSCHVDNMQAETLEAKIAEYAEILEDPLFDNEVAMQMEKCMEVMRLYADLSFAAVKKVTSMLACAMKDGRVRGTLLYHGTGPGRSSARLIQPQNFKKAEINLSKQPAWTPKGPIEVKWPDSVMKPTDFCYDMLKRGTIASEIDLFVGEPLEAIASSIRHFIPATLDADYAGLQARVVNWLSGQQDALDRFAKGIDAYKVLAAIIFNMRADDIQNPSKERDLGKVGELGCGFQMAWKKFLTTCHIQYGLTWVTAAMAMRTVDAYRSSHPQVVKFWWACDNAARRAIAQPNRRFDAGPKITFEARHHCKKLFLFARLPSGREIAYAEPRIETWTNPKTEEIKENQITYYGKPTTATGGSGNIWMRIPTYGGKFAENVTMGVEADLINHGCTLAIRKGFDPFVLVHDQALASRKAGQTAPEFAACLADLPAWAHGLPLKVEAKFCKYYAK
jgi:DNA polymerase